MKRLLVIVAAVGIGAATLCGCGNKSEDSALEKAAPPPSSDAVAVQGNPNKVLPGSNSTQSGSGTQGALGP